MTAPRWRLPIVAAAVAVAGMTSGCATSSGPDVGLEGLALVKVAPITIIPGSKLEVKGESFVTLKYGSASLHLVGNAGSHAVNVHWPAMFVDFNTLSVPVTAAMLGELGTNEDFHGVATVDVVATSDDQTYSSGDLLVDLKLREQLQPAPTSFLGQGVIFVNDDIVVMGDGFLLGGDEGVTVAQLDGCFTPDAGGACRPIALQEIPMTPVDPLLRTAARFPFRPGVAGIKPGTFTGHITIENQQTARSPQAAAPLPASYDLVTSQIFSIDPPAASLGQYVFVRGGGFVGGEPSGSTEVELSGSFTAAGGGAAPAALTLIPQFVDGKTVRYVVNTDDELGHTIDLRVATGTFTGTATPIVSFGSERVRGVAKTVTFSIAPVKQILFLDYRPSYVEELRDFGLRAVDNRIRDRIKAVVDRAYAGVNVEVRTEPPADFELYEHVELVGVDPNGQGLFGYDNSPGKDNGNLRLYDRLGGVNALTQADGYSGYGGVFVASLMGFSKHPGKFATSVPGADKLFDQMFDPFRPDLGHEPVRSADLSASASPITDGSACPASDRASQIQCAVFVMGNLIGGTLSHEIGHSLGLANPYAEGFHDSGDAPNRLMDNGGDRPFVERAELQGQGPGVFCDDEYSYLRMILPVAAPPPAVDRPTCF